MLIYYIIRHHGSQNDITYSPILQEKCLPLKRNIYDCFVLFGLVLCLIDTVQVIRRLSSFHWWMKTSVAPPCISSETRAGILE